MLAARQCGMPASAIQTHASALELMKYTVKTIYGVSYENYSGSPFEPLFGTGQGSGASPAVWLTLVVLLLHTFDKVVPKRMSFSTPDNKVEHSRLVDAFVDDTYIGFTDSEGVPYDTLIARLQDVAQTWSDLLHHSGGNLNLSKCIWYVMYWEWASGRPQLRKQTQEDRKISLQASDTGRTSIIKRVSLESSSRMLGVNFNPLGNFSAQIEVCKKAADAFAIRLRSPKISSADTAIFHRAIYIPTIRYCLPAISVEQEESLHQIQTKIIPAILQKMHINSHRPTEIRHGPKALGGLELYDVRTEHGIEQIKYLRNAIFSDSPTGKLLRISLQYLQLEAGTGQSLLENPTVELPYLTPRWLLSVRAFLAQHNLTLSITDQPRVCLQSQTDEFIMQRQHLSRYSVSQQPDINLVRIHLQVSTLLELSDPARHTAILLSYLDGVRPSGWVSAQSWPRQDLPTKSQRRLWKRYLVSSFLQYIPLWKISPGLTSNSPTTALNTHWPHDNKVTPVQFSSLAEFHQSFQKTKRHLVTGAQQLATDSQLWRAFRSKERLLIASDGGLSETLGTFGWVLSTKTSLLFQGGGPVDGPFDTASSTRSELAGITSALLLISSISQLWGIQHRCRFKLFTDSRSAISKIKRFCRRQSTPRCQPFDSDLLSITRDLLQELHHRVQFSWVKGHQDLRGPTHTLTKASRLNTQADALATQYRLHGRSKSSQHVDHQRSQQVSMTINGKRITSQFDDCIRYHINGYHLRHYLQHRKKWSDTVWETIDFDIFGKHYRRLNNPIKSST